MSLASNLLLGQPCYGATDGTTKRASPPTLGGALRCARTDPSAPRRRRRRARRRGLGARRLQRPAAGPGCGTATSSPWCSPGPRCPPLAGAVPGPSSPSGGTPSWPGGSRCRCRWTSATSSSSPSSATAPAPPGRQTLAYSDPAANAGADPVTTLDSNDEIAFMAADTGGARPEGHRRPGRRGAVVGRARHRHRPAGHQRRGPRHAASGYAYLFVRSGAALSPGAGKDYVDYDFDPADPERATSRTPRCRATGTPRTSRPAGRATSCALGTGPDILDRHRNLFAVGELRSQRGHLLGRRRRLRHQHRRARAA